MKNKSRFLFIFLFLVVIWLPLIITATTKKNNKIITESSTPLPSLHFNKDSINNFFPAYIKFYNQNFGLRPRFIHWNNFILANYLHVSPSHQVVIGKDGWLFYNGGLSDNFITQDYRGLRPFSQKELAQLTNNLLARQNWLAKQGIKYLVVIPPNKESVYPEYLPNKINKRNESRLDQFLLYAHTHSNLNVISLRDGLQKAKANHEELYFKNDSHWNDLGAYFGYKDIMKQLTIWLPVRAKSLADFTFLKTSTEWKDLAILMNLPNYGVALTSVLKQQNSCTQSAIDSDRVATPPQPLKVICPDQKLKILVFNDSFMGALIPFLAPHFEKSIFIWQYDIDPNLVKKEHPDIVLQEIVERNLVVESIIDNKLSA